MTQSTLCYSFFRSKNHIRVHVARKTSMRDAKGVLKFSQKSIGSFKYQTAQLPIPLDILDDALTPEERVEIKNFLYTVNFSKQYFDVEIDSLERESIKLPDALLAATRELAVLADQQGIEFIPHQVFVDALLAKLSGLEEVLVSKMGTPPCILKKYGVDRCLTGESEHMNLPETEEHYTEEEREKYQRKIDEQSRPLFEAILGLAKKKGVIYAEFERFILDHYGKIKHIKPTYLYRWAGADLKPLPKWLFAAAIDYLMEKGINPITVIPTAKVAEHWARERTQQLASEQACDVFIERFEVPEHEKAIACAEIAAIYLKANTASE